MADRVRTPTPAEPASAAPAGGGLRFRDAAMFLTAIGFAFLARKFSDLAVAYPTAGVLTAACTAAAVALFIAALLGIATPPRLLAYTFVASLLVCGAFDYMAASAGPALPSDEVAITSVAAQVAAQGGNPYTVDYRAISPVIAGQPSAFFTPTFSGERVAEYAYPAGTFLVLVPFVAAFGTGGLTHLYLLLFLVSAVLAWLLVPPTTRLVIPAVLLLLTVAGVGGGSTDTIYLPFLVLAVWRWPRFVSADAHFAIRLLGPVALGVACAMKQNAWVVAPMLATGIAVEAHARGRPWARLTAAYAGVAALVFLAVDAPYMALDLSAWSRAVLAPLSLHTVLNGDGLTAIPLAGAAGGDHLELLGNAAAAALVATLLFAVAHFEHARRVLPLLAVVPLMVSTRSLSSYVDFLVLPALVAAATVPALGAAARQLRPRLRRGLHYAGSAAALAAGGLVVAALVQRPPLSLTVMETDAAGGAWRSATVMVENRSGRVITPAFFAAPRDALQYTLTRVDGPATLDPGVSALYRLSPLAADHGPAPGESVRIVALADRPESISQSDPFVIGDARSP